MQQWKYPHESHPWVGQNPPPPRETNPGETIQYRELRHFTHQTLTILSFGYITSDGINAIVIYIPIMGHFIIAKKKSARGFKPNPRPKNKQCNAVLQFALTTASRAVDGSKGGVTNLYLGWKHPG